MIYALAFIGLQLLVYVGAAALAPTFTLAREFTAGLESGDVRAIFALTTINLVLGMAIIAGTLRYHQSTFADAGWRSFSIKKALLYLVGVYVAFGIGVNILLVLAGLLVPGFDPNQAQTNDFTGTAALHYPILSILALIIFPPILEETIFRGYLFPALSKRLGIKGGAVVSSLIFGLSHLQVNVGIYTFVLGLLLCWLYVKTKSIIPGVILHTINNALAFIAMTYIAP